MIDHFDQRFACIVGAPRTGTTALARYLSKHRGVCFSSVKEPHYFAQFDLSELPEDELRERVSAEYLDRYFNHCDKPQSLLMEGSVTYLYVPEQIRAILRLWPEAKFIIGVRDPMKMLPSLHQRLLFLGDETERSFDRAWKLIEARKQGRKIPRSCVDPRWLRYDEVGRLGDYVQQFIDVVGRERCFISVYDDLAADPAATYASVLQFLDLPHDKRKNFTPRRSSRGFKIGWLQRLLKRPPVAVRAKLAGSHYRQRVERLENLAKGETKATRLLLAARKRLLEWNEAEPPPVRLSAAIRTEIREKYSDDVDRLARITGRDLSHWLRV